jgi:hypothetical protein
MMNRSALVRVVLVVVTSTLANFAIADNDPYARVPIILQAANSWHEGEPIPTELQRYRQSRGDLPDPTDSASLIAEIENLALLAALSINLSADPQCQEDAFAQGMYAGGPTRFFEIVERDLIEANAWSNPWVSEVRSRIRQPHVVVDALFIRDADMPREQTNRVLDRIERDLRSGGKWKIVYTRYADEFGYKSGNTTKVGNLGHWVIFADPALGHGHFVDLGPDAIQWRGEELPRRLSRLAFFDASHLPAIMRSATGDILRLHSAEYHEYVLYQVQEVYPGAR